MSRNEPLYYRSNLVPRTPQACPLPRAPSLAPAAFIVFATVVASAQVSASVFAAKALVGASLVGSPPTEPLAGRLRADTTYQSPPDPLALAALEAVIRAANGPGGSAGAGLSISLGHHTLTVRVPDASDPSGYSNVSSRSLLRVPIAPSLAGAAEGAAVPLTSADIPSIVSGSGWAGARFESAFRAAAAAGASAWSEGLVLPSGSAVVAPSSPSASGTIGGSSATDALGQTAGTVSSSIITGVALGATSFGNRAHVTTGTMSMQGVSPNLLATGPSAVLYTAFYAATDAPGVEESTLSHSELLSTARGGQGVLVGKSVADDVLVGRGQVGLVASEAKLSQPFVSGSGGSEALPRSVRSPVRAMALVGSAPGFGFARAAGFSSTPVDSLLTSLPAAVRMLDTHLTGPGIPRPPLAAVSRLVRAQAAQQALARLTARRAGGALSATSRARAQLAAALHARLTRYRAGGGSGGGGATGTLFGLSSGAPRDPPAVARHLFTGLSLGDLPQSKLFVGLRDEATVSGIDKAKLKAALSAALSTAARARTGALAADEGDAGGWEVDDAADLGRDSDTTVQLLQLVFGGLAIVAMALCFFSLLASMLANIADQKREVGVLRALGMRPSSLTRLYMEEAFLLVLCASLVGVAIGCLVAATFSQQQALFTGTPSSFVFPYGVTAAIVLASVGLSFLAACLPARRLLRRPITALLRGGG